MTSPGAALITAAPAISFSQMSRGRVIRRPVGGVYPPYLRGGYAHLIRPHNHRDERRGIRTHIHARCGRRDRAFSGGCRRGWSTPYNERTKCQAYEAHIRKKKGGAPF